MQSEARVVVVLGTGGTIAGLGASPADSLDYRAAQIGVADLVASAPPSTLVPIETEQVAQLDSKDMDFATWRALALRVAHHAARPEVAGIVITHGTDTLEETAYFLARTVPLDKPVVLTAAMRPASSRDADGPRNIADAITLAAQADRHGVLVVLAGQVHAARDVRKIHPHRLDAFSSGESGPLARIADGRIDVLRDRPAVEDTVDIDVLPQDASTWPWVEIVTSTGGADGRVVELLVQSGVDGIVVAGTGNGSLHHRLDAALTAARQHGTPVLRSTRCLDGSIIPVAADRLESAVDLTPVKARIELILRLLVGRSEARVAAAGQGRR